jgi:hypothetical protein
MMVLLVLFGFFLIFQMNTESFSVGLGVLGGIHNLLVLSKVFTKLLVIFETLLASVKGCFSHVTSICAIITLVLLRLLLEIVLASFVE